MTAHFLDVYYAFQWDLEIVGCGLTLTWGGGQINRESLYLPEISYLGRKQAPADSPGSDLLGNSLISVFLTIFVRFCFLY